MALAALLLAPPQAARGASPNVAALQVALRARATYFGTIDGIAGPRTIAGVRAFQRRAGLAVDGIAGPRTRRALGRLGRPLYGTRILRRGSIGWDVGVLQFLLETHGFPCGSVDGGFGFRTDVAVRRLQAFYGLAPDGIVGPWTRAALRRPPPRAPYRLYRPIAAPIGDGYGPRGTGFHAGLDFIAPWGAAVRAAGYGRVIEAGWNDGFGLDVVLRHSGGVTTRYAHLSSIAVRFGRWVGAGALIGRVGATGRASGPHLHFEVAVRGANVDPRSALGW